MTKMKKTDYLNEEIMSIIESTEFGNRNPIKVLLTRGNNSDEGHMINKYFILQEICKLLNYHKDTLNSQNIKYFDKGKYIINRPIIREFVQRNYKKPFTGYNILNPESIPSRGLLIINIDSLCKLIMYSRKPELVELKDWVCNNILSGSMKLNCEYDPIILYHKLKKELYRIGCNTLEYKILDIVFDKLFSLTYTFAINSFSTTNKKIVNPYELSYYIGGMTGFIHFKNSINISIVLLQSGHSLEDLSRFIIPINPVK